MSGKWPLSYLSPASTQVIRRLSALLTLTLLMSCSGGGGGSSAPVAVTTPPSVQPPTTGDDPTDTEDETANAIECSVTLATDASSRAWPVDSWSLATPESLGICPDAIDNALDYAVAQGNDTGAVLVIRNGLVVTEWYDAQKDADDMVTSWSVAKSFTSALVGAAIDDGYIENGDQSLAEFIAAWQGTDKEAITLDHLLTVRTALELITDDDGDGIPDGSDLYASPDQLQMSLDRPLIGTPGEKLYRYSNSDVMLAGEVVGAATSKRADEFLQQRIAEVIGFSGDWWVDQTDHVMSYCCLDATPLDFARFGLLYARSGEWNGTQVLSDQWIQQSTAPALQGNYGYYWWPVGNGGFAALGVMGQLIAVYPDLDLVVLRFSNYTRVGDGGTVRADDNYHQTFEPENFDVATFLDLILEGVADLAQAEDGPETEINHMPRAEAGLPQTALVGSAVTLSGHLSSDTDGDTLSHSWALISRPDSSNATITTSGSTASILVDAAGTYSFDLRVDDGVVSSVSDRLTVEVLESRAILQSGTSNGLWPNYGGNLSSDKYSPLARITADNINDLEVIWRWRSPDNDLPEFQNVAFESTPLMIDGVLFTSTSFSQVAAINAETGQTLWLYDPESYRNGTPPNNGFLHRGLAYSETHGRKALYVATGDARLIALDPVSGEPLASFGHHGNGIVNLLAGLPRLDEDVMTLEHNHDHDVPAEGDDEGEDHQQTDLSGSRIQVGNTSPPIVCQDVLIVGSSIHDGVVLPPAPPGDIRGYDVDSGELLWTFHTVPREGEFGVETWGDDSWQQHGNTNAWAPLSADDELGHVYLPIGCPTNDYYGGRRPGDNLFANSVLALDCRTGQRVWHYQTVHHDIWDYDLPAAPNLVDINVNGESIKALAQVSKQGFVYVLDRESGEPVWPIPETPVSASVIPGEVTSPTQPIPTKPPPFVRQGSDRTAFLDPGLAENFDVGPLYTPPTLNGIVMTPGIGGGANWGGASFDPTEQILYVNGFGPMSFVVRLERGNQSNFYYGLPSILPGSQTGSLYPGNGSAITAYDLNKGEILWQVPGDSNASAMGNAASIIAGDLLYYRNSSLDTLNVFDKTSGNLLRSVPLGGHPTGVPMTYELSDRQYIVVALGRRNDLMELVALGLVE